MVVVNMAMALVIIFAAVGADVGDAKRYFGQRCSHDADCTQHDANLRFVIFIIIIS
jgi:hypothetical protein